MKKAIARVVLAGALVALLTTLAGCSRSSSRAELELDAAAPPPVVHTFAAGGPPMVIGNVGLEISKTTFGYPISASALLGGTFFGLQGSATKTVKLTRVAIGPSTATALGYQDIALRLCSPPPALGDASVLFPTQGYTYDGDGGGQISTASVLFYIAAPVQTITCSALRDTQLVSLPVATAGAAGNTIVWDFCNGGNTQCPTLHGTNEAILLIVVAGGALAGQKTPWDLTWTEE
jgi:hypothetical protein